MLAECGIPNAQLCPNHGTSHFYSSMAIGGAKVAVTPGTYCLNMPKGSMSHKKKNSNINGIL